MQPQNFARKKFAGRRPANFFLDRLGRAWFYDQKGLFCDRKGFRFDATSFARGGRSGLLVMDWSDKSAQYMLLLTAGTVSRMQYMAISTLYPHMQNWLHPNPFLVTKKTFFGHQKNFVGHKTLFDRDGLEKKNCGPSARNFFFLAKILGLHLCRRVLAEILAKICAAV